MQKMLNYLDHPITNNAHFGSTFDSVINPASGAGRVCQVTFNFIALVDESIHDFIVRPDMTEIEKLKFSQERAEFTSVFARFWRTLQDPKAHKLKNALSYADPSVAHSILISDLIIRGSDAFGGAEVQSLDPGIVDYMLAVFSSPAARRAVSRCQSNLME